MSHNVPSISFGLEGIRELLGSSFYDINNGVVMKYPL